MCVRPIDHRIAAAVVVGDVGIGLHAFRTVIVEPVILRIGIAFDVNAMSGPGEVDDRIGLRGSRGVRLGCRSEWHCRRDEIGDLGD